jgi:alkanesulfonate monooxygenase SsuD/methylene tetrahydromethanopterin reductase-like flavin-dependent oxidoreductase (luciferase family)
VKYGFVTSFGGARDYVTLAREAEQHGWDGVFAWDDISVDPRDVFDPWAILGAMAVATERVTLGAMVFSLARRRPWKVARESMTVDHLSGGRLVIPVGLGGTWDGGYSRVSTDDPDRKVRAAKVDECLDILELAWTGELVSYAGTHYQMTDLLFLPRPIQRPRIPIWTVGAWPHTKSLARSARWDGCIVYDMSGSSQEGAVSAETVRRVKSWMDEHRTVDTPFEIIVEGETSGTDAKANRATLEPLIDAGATWWIESRWEDHESFESLLQRVRKGPPGV